MEKRPSFEPDYVKEGIGGLSFSIILIAIIVLILIFA